MSDFAIDDRFKQTLDREFRPATYSELYEALKECNREHSYFVFGQTFADPIDPVAMPRPTLNSDGANL